MGGAVRQGLARRPVCVSCGGWWYFMQEHGGVRAELRWYGPLSMAALARAEQAAPSR